MCSGQATPQDASAAGQLMDASLKNNLPRFAAGNTPTIAELTSGQSGKYIRQLCEETKRTLLMQWGFFQCENYFTLYLSICTLKVTPPNMEGSLFCFHAKPERIKVQSHFKLFLILCTLYIQHYISVFLFSVLLLTLLVIFILLFSLYRPE